MIYSNRVTVNGVELGVEAARAAEEAGVNPADDVRRVQSGEVTTAALLAECLDGADDEGAWREYVSDIALAAGR